MALTAALRAHPAAAARAQVTSDTVRVARSEPHDLSTLLQSPQGSCPRTRQPSFLSFWTADGAVLNTNKYVGENGGPSAFSAFAIKWGMYSRGECWEDIAYGMPYGGVGFYAAEFFDIEQGHVGTPMSLFIFQGATLARVSPRMTFNYEWNLGLSFGWEPYDPFDTPLNIAIGSSVNAHIAFNFYFRWMASQYLDLNFGLNLAHFSNGASRLPNAGFNLAAPMVELALNFNRNARASLYETCGPPPPFMRHVDHDISMTISSRQTEFAANDQTGLPLPYIDRKFKVLGLSYAMLFANDYKYKWGPTADLIYDESSNVTAWREKLPGTDAFYDRVRLGPMGDRVSLGVGVRGELTMMRYSIFATMGWNAIWGNKDDTRLYQVLGLKAYLSQNLFGTFGIRASHFSSAQYLYWSLGYTINGRNRGIKER
ncbi:MAG: acyloxyacyl hydrolase [Rikenellaceae bacterium]|jgi:hypothetical protein|nr:acyloxyacyl hydrolase [Rikenellaceae bacterium]